MNILSLLGPWGWSLGRLLILVLAALGLAVNPSARSAELTTKPNAGGEAGAMSEPRYLLFWRAPEQALELVRQLGSKGDSRSRLLGFGVPMSAFDEEKQLPTRVHTAFPVASRSPIRFGWHGGKCVLAVERREGKLVAAWSSRRDRLRMLFLQSGTSESCYERDDI